ncbi:TOMM precursor leader peptide-binding protein [Hyalangium rubrum]|uniref:TOMM leader peptide-binding protein n=1 Tax=Hyalangium rubrum TaxID=3103134 RepID=A0ABU5HI38_9BACT|nr:TOMM precursor leader peptide-binding protein [Hyalangium sp. s54d21]MDY7233136.1 TOMM precursor leader peptide-binding protein [Hyalangium sp. s54d21]
MNEELEARRPRLGPSRSVVRDGDATCYIMTSGRELLRCQGTQVSLLVDQLLPLMDGTRTVGEIRAALAGKPEAGSVDTLLDLLWAHHVVVDVGPEQAFSADELRAFGGVVALLSRSFPDPYRPLERLRQARVVVVGHSELSRELVLALAECAIGAIELVTEGAPVSLEVQLPVRVQAHPIEALEAVVPGASLVIGVQDGEFSFTRRMRELNRLCLRLGSSLLAVRLTLDAEGWIGPLHTPGTACFECVNLRQESHLKAWKEQLLHCAQVEQGLLVGKRLGFPPFQRQLANAVAVEVLLQLTGLEPSRLSGRSLLVDVLTQERSLHPVLKHPACPACGHSPAARVFPWGDEEIRLGRMLLKQEEGR